jgi:hypothetical protein
MPAAATTDPLTLAALQSSLQWTISTVITPAVIHDGISSRQGCPTASGEPDTTTRVSSRRDRSVHRIFNSRRLFLKRSPLRLIGLYDQRRELRLQDINAWLQHLGNPGNGKHLVAELIESRHHGIDQPGDKLPLIR